MLESYHCPAGYCQCRRTDNTSEVCSSVYYYDDEDLQCVCDRKGNFTLVYRCLIIGVFLWQEFCVENVKMVKD